MFQKFCNKGFRPMPSSIVIVEPANGFSTKIRSAVKPRQIPEPIDKAIASNLRSAVFVLVSHKANSMNRQTDHRRSEPAEPAQTALSL